MRQGGDNENQPHQYKTERVGYHCKKCRTMYVGEDIVTGRAPFKSPPHEVMITVCKRQQYNHSRDDPEVPEIFKEPVTSDLCESKCIFQKKYRTCAGTDIFYT